MTRPALIEGAEKLLYDLESWGDSNIEWQKVWNTIQQQVLIKTIGPLLSKRQRMTKNELLVNLEYWECEE